MKKRLFCAECFYKWKADEEKVFCCPICGSKEVCTMDRVVVNL